MNEEYNIQIEELKSNITKLEELYDSVLSQNAKLEEEVKNLNTELNSKKIKLTDIETKYNNLKLAQAFGNNAASVEDEKEAKAKLNQIIREINKCITLLSKK